MLKPRWMPLLQLCYAQVVKSYRRRRIVGVTHRVVVRAYARPCRLPEAINGPGLARACRQLSQISMAAN